MDQNISNKVLNGKHILGIDFGTKFTGLATYKVGNDPFVLTWGRIKYQTDDQLIKDITGGGPFRPAPAAASTAAGAAARRSSPGRLA